MVSNYIINFVLFPYCTRVLGVERFGTINFTENIVQYFVFLGMMGVTHVGVREIAKQKRKEDRDKCFSSIFGLNMIFTIISLAIYIPMIFVVNRFAATRTLFLLGSLQILFTAFSIEWYFRGTENFRYITVRNIIVKLCYLACVFSFVRSPDDYIVFYLLTVSVTVVCSIINFLYARRFINLSFREINIRRYVKSNLSLGAYSILTSMYTTFNVAYLGFVWGDIQVGYYSTALKLYTVILGFYSAFTGVMLPRMTNINVDGNGSAFRSMIHKSFLLLLTISIPLVIVLYVLAPELVTILAGESYAASIDLSRIVVPMLFVVGVAQVLAFQILIPKGFDKKTLCAAIIGAVVGVTSNLILTTKFGAVGACVTVVITEILVTLYYLYVTTSNKLITFELSLLVKHIIVALPYIILCIVPKKIFVGNSALVLLVSSFLCVVYFFISQAMVLRNEIITSAISNFSKRKGHQ